MEREYKRYHIAILPPPAIVTRAIAASTALRPLEPLFVLNQETYFPHVSLYHVPFTDEALPQVRRELGAIASATAPFLLRHETYYPDQGVWVGVRYVADKAILDLHTTVVERLKGYRAVQDDARYLARWADLSPARRKNIHDCGWSNAFTLFSPHLSFAKLPVPRADILVHLPYHDLSFRAEIIALIERGEYGASLERVAVSSLGGLLQKS